MATISDVEKWEHSDSHHEEEEEALSLCDLPDNLIKEENQSSKLEEEEQHDHQETEASTTEDFNFGQWDDSDYTRSEMCAADDIFFKGLILPFRHSINKKFCKQESRNPSRCLSRSESFDSGGFTSFSSRSSSRSSRNQFSSSSGSIKKNDSRISANPRIHYQFHAHPSPKPQFRLSKKSSRSSARNRNRKSSKVWNFFRLGLFRTPEIELQDLKIRTYVSGNSSSISCSTNNNSSVRIGSNNSRKVDKQNQRKQNFFEKRSSGILLSGCISAATAVKSVPSNINIKENCSGKITGEEKLRLDDQQVKIKKKMIENQRQIKQIPSVHRMFEWIKELS